MENINWINAIGLLLDIVGFTLIYFAGADADFFKQQKAQMKHQEKETPNMHPLNKWDGINGGRDKIIFRSNAGFSFVILGFILQLASLVFVPKQTNTNPSNNSCHHSK